MLPMARALHVIFAALASMVLALSFLYPSPSHAEDEFLDPEKAFSFSAAIAAPAGIDVHFKIAPRYYMYRERFAFTVTPDSDPSVIGQAVFPAGIVTYDPTFEKDLEVYYDQVTIHVPLQAGTTGPLTFSVTSQGCADAGLCYPPMTQEISLTPTLTGYEASGPGVTNNVPGPAAQLPRGSKGGAGDAAAAGATGFGGALALGDTGFAAHLASAGWLEVIGLCLVLGLLLSFTPCVLPMVPILLAIVAGDAGQPRKVTRVRGLALAAVFVLGMSLVYTALGVAAGLIGASLAVWLQTPWVLALFAILLALLALAMFDVFTLQAPTGMQTALNARLARIPGGRYGGVFLMGMLSALIVGPCVAAPLAGVLLFISQTGDLVLGGTALFAMAWGEGLLLLAVGASSGALLPKAGPWMNGVKRFFGILLLATAWWMVYSLLPAWLMMLGWAFLALWSAVMLGAFEPIRAGAGAGSFFNKSMGLLLALWAVILVVGVSAGGRELFRPLAPLTAYSTGGTLPRAGVLAGQAPSAPTIKPQFQRVSSLAQLDALLASAERPVMLDFYADWCVSCIEMEKFTFSDPDVARQMSGFLLLQADVTKNTPEDRALLKRYSLFGPPGIIFFDAQGTELDDARVVGFKNATAFGAVLGRVLNGS
ncbi:MAG TPA: protein-disulfide reductase DsbD [Candidimonas sp.]|nr:protein-disulfide reductase DsbD [Candidimonas sp.]